MVRWWREPGLGTQGQVSVSGNQLVPSGKLFPLSTVSFLICKMGNVSRLCQNGTERIKQSNPILLLHRENFKITKGFYVDTWQPSEQPRALLSPFFN